MLKPIALLVWFFSLMVPGLAAGEIKTEPVRFAPGKSQIVIKGTIEGRNSISYLIEAEAGQTLSLVLKPSNASTYFNLYEPGRGPGDQALARSEVTGDGVTAINRFSGKLPLSGVYKVNVFLYRAEARRNKISHFQLEVAFVGDAAGGLDSPVKADFADGLQGGPDFWRVTGAGKNLLTVYREPSTWSGRVERFADGAILRNRGCRIVSGTRWCRVEAPNNSAVVGWVLGEKLRESGPPTDALVPGTPFHATGHIPCAADKGQPLMQCRFGVVRQGMGKAHVTIFLPGGVERVIRFENGVPVGSDAPEGTRLSFSKKADLFMISINAARFEIPDAVINGG
jgi:hypothetical protein